MTAPFPRFQALLTKAGEARFRCQLPRCQLAIAKALDGGKQLNALISKGKPKLTPLPITTLRFQEKRNGINGFRFPSFIYTTYIWACSGNTRPYVHGFGFHCQPVSKHPRASSHHHFPPPITIQGGAHVARSIAASARRAALSVCVRPRGSDQHRKAHAHHHLAEPMPRLRADLRLRERLRLPEVSTSSVQRLQIAQQTTRCGDPAAQATPLSEQRAQETNTNLNRKERVAATALAGDAATLTTPQTMEKRYG